MTYHRDLKDNERIIRIALNNGHHANMLFTQIAGGDTWVCVTTTETLEDLKRGVENQCT